MSKTSRVNVAVRIRPLLPEETQKGYENCITVGKTESAQFVELKNPRSSFPEVPRFTFDSCYGVECGQGPIYENEVAPLIGSVFAGINTTVLAYGITGAGKTHTMQGDETDPGLLPRTVRAVLQEAPSRKAQIIMSYCEIYCERVYDLLAQDGKDCPILQDYDNRVYVKGLVETDLKSMDQFDRLYATASTNRSTATTGQNDRSSRSHAILMLRVTTTVGTKSLVGKMHLIDLAGCEDNRKTGNSGQRMTESANINQSLFVLHKCIDGLAKGESRIPYRDSRLTRLLADSLGGGAQSVMITNVSPSSFNYSDTLTTLNFASKSKQIVNKPIVNEIKEVKPAEDRQAQLQLWRLGQGKLPEPQKERAKEQAVQKKVDQLLAPVQPQTLSPFLREQKELSLDTRRRLEQLEALLQREQAGLDDVLQGERPEALSAIARARQAKATIAKGKQLEASDLAAAVQTYETALKYIEAPHHLAKLQERIDKLKAELAADDKMDFEVISVSAPPTFVSDGKENSPNRMTVNNGRIVISKTLDVVSTLEASLLKTLNEGSEADLLELNGIGKKRAESIVSWRQGGNLFDSISDLRKIDGFSKNFAATFFKRNATDRIDFGS